MEGALDIGSLPRVAIEMMRGGGGGGGGAGFLKALLSPSPRFRNREEGKSRWLKDGNSSSRLCGLSM